MNALPPKSDVTHRGQGITLREGGWVLIAAGIVLTTLVIWAVAPAILRKAAAPPGDGKDIDSYGFYLSSLAVDRSLVVAAARHRDMLPRWDFPPVYAGRDIASVNAAQRGKYIVSTDRVIGIEIDGRARAYPISVMNVHEIVNDRVGSGEIVVTYNWQCDSPRVYRRSLAEGSSPTFGHSGLFYNSNTLLYDEPAQASDNAIDTMPHASLWSQFTGECIAGPRVGERLEPIPCQLTSWAMWLDLHPQTEVIQPDPDLRKRYQRAKPDSYFLKDELPYPVSFLPAESGRPAKARVIDVTVGGDLRVFDLAELFESAAELDTRSEVVGDVTLHFQLDRNTHTAHLSWEPREADVRFQHSLWFAWSAFHSEAK